MLQHRLAVAVRAALCLALACTALSRLPRSPTLHAAVSPAILQATVIDVSAPETTVHDDADGCLYTFYLPDGHHSPGDRIALRGTPRAFDTARNPGAYSETADAQRRGLCATFDTPEVRLLQPYDARDPRFWAARFRIWGRREIAARLPPDEAAVLTGMLWGDHRSLQFEDTEAFSATGTSHLLVTAGLHIGFAAGVVAALLRACTVERGVAALLTAAAVWLACIVSGAHLPSVRAAVMISVVCGARVLGTEASPLRGFAYALLFVLCIEPDTLHDSSAYLSFSCVFAIVYLAESIERRCLAIGCPPFCAKAFAITLAAQVGTWALIAADFHQVSLIAPLANLVAVPLALSILAPAALLLAGAGLRCAGLVAVMLPPIHGLLLLLLAWIRWCAALPFAKIGMHAPSMWTLIAYECALVFFCTADTNAAVTAVLRCAHHLRDHPHGARLRAELLRFAFSAERRRWLTGGALSIAALAVCASGFARAHTLRITVLDVGQGDGIVIETPNGHTILIDTGGRLELHSSAAAASPAEIAAARVLLPFLRYEGVSRIDLLLLTHPHGDHAGGAAPVLRTLPVTAFLDSGQRYGGHAYQDAVQAAALAHVPRIIAERGQTIAFDDGVTLRVLAPEHPFFHDGRNDVNENSIVALLTYQRFRVLFTGDAGLQAEARLLARGDDLHADLLKVGHHGSAYATSAAFLAAVRPHIAIISVGRHNLFHHPAPPTLARLRDAGATIYRTDRCGAVTIEDTTISTMISCP